MYEAHLANGLPAFNLVGLPETEVKESRERVRAALQNAQFYFPTWRRITVNLAPADLPKESGASICRSRSAFWLRLNRYPDIDYLGSRPLSRA